MWYTRFLLNLNINALLHKLHSKLISALTSSRGLINYQLLHCTSDKTALAVKSCAASTTFFFLIRTQCNSCPLCQTKEIVIWTQMMVSAQEKSHSFNYYRITFCCRQSNGGGDKAGLGELLQGKSFGKLPLLIYWFSQVSSVCQRCFTVFSYSFFDQTSFVNLTKALCSKNFLSVTSDGFRQVRKIV